MMDNEYSSEEEGEQSFANTADEFPSTPVNVPRAPMEASICTPPENGGDNDGGDMNDNAVASGPAASFNPQPRGSAGNVGTARGAPGQFPVGGGSRLGAPWSYNDDDKLDEARFQEIKRSVHYKQVKSIQARKPGKVEAAKMNEVYTLIRTSTITKLNL